MSNGQSGAEPTDQDQTAPADKIVSLQDYSTPSQPDSQPTNRPVSQTASQSAGQPMRPIAHPKSGTKLNVGQSLRQSWASTSGFQGT